MLLSEGKISATGLGRAGHFPGMRVIQELEITFLEQSLKIQT
jgi:hypothetical protein